MKEYPSVAADSDFYSFTTIMVKRYVDIPCDEVAKVDSNHLNLGMRYAWISSDLLYKAGERFDGENYNIGIVTIQNLPYPEISEAMRITNQRIYLVGSGLEEPFKAEITRIPPIHY